MRVDIGSLLIAQHTRRIRRHLLARCAQLHDECFPYRRIDQLRTGAPALPHITMAFEAADGLEQLLASSRIATRRTLCKGAPRNKEAGESAGPEYMYVFDHSFPSL